MRHLASIVNLEYHPTSAFRKTSAHFHLRNLAVLSLSQAPTGLTASHDSVTRNSSDSWMHYTFNVTMRRHA
ncbi:hypothetical protein, partial [Salmonella enterica]|uniref:hypothetical protein n=1 Tax=Salmonella enterica TaxID=28901 RepID=UPI00398C4C21